MAVLGSHPFQTKGLFAGQLRHSGSVRDAASEGKVDSSRGKKNPVLVYGLHMCIHKHAHTKERMLRFLVFADCCGVNAPTLATFELPTLYHLMLTYEEIHV